MPTSLSDEEREQLEDEIRAELEKEHVEKLEAFEVQREEARQRGRARAQRRAESERAALKRKMRDDFYKEKGYLPYVDSRGREKWLPPEEHAWRTKMRRRAAERHPDQIWGRARTMKRYLPWVLVVLGGILLGLYLLR